MNTKIAAIAAVAILAGSIATSVVLLNWLSGTIGSPAQEETLQIARSGLWCGYGLPYCQAAVSIVNNKDVAAAIQKITVRGIESEWKDIYFWEGEIGSVSSLSPASNNLTGTSVEIAVEGKERTFQQAAGNIVIGGYRALILYIRNAGNIDMENLPEGKVTIAVFTPKNVYWDEASLTLKEEPIPFAQTEQLTITRADWIGSGTAITLTVRNTGTTDVIVTSATVNGVATSYTAAPQAIGKNTEDTVVLTHSWTAGDSYQIKLLSQKGTNFVYNAVAGP